MEHAQKIKQKYPTELLEAIGYNEKVVIKSKLKGWPTEVILKRQSHGYNLPCFWGLYPDDTTHDFYAHMIIEFPLADRTPLYRLFCEVDQNKKA